MISPRLRAAALLRTKPTSMFRRSSAVVIQDSGDVVLSLVARGAITTEPAAEQRDY
jgi:hypothetical protein